VLVGGVIHDEIGDDPDAVGMRRLEKALEVGHGAVIGMDGPVVRHVVAVVTQGRGEEREQPETIHPQLFQIIEAAGQPGKVPDAVAVTVLEGPHVKLVEDSVLVPERIAHRQRSTR
jgi:hypothetical protein